MENSRKEQFTEEETNFARDVDRVSRQRGDFWGRALVISLLLAAVIGNFIAAYLLDKGWLDP